MNNKYLMIYENNILFNILFEIENEIKFSIIAINKKNLSKLDEFINLNYLIITQNEIKNLSNQIILNKFPINIFKFIEKLNVEFLKLEFNKKSSIKIGKYIFNLNSREMSHEKENLKLTEKEINSIIYLFKAKKSVNVQELQSKVWGYQPDLETHTVETHIYRLRKKILKTFKDQKFIFSNKIGYKII